MAVPQPFIKPTRLESALVRPLITPLNIRKTTCLLAIDLIEGEAHKCAF
jgi:hypothetical protein